MSKIRKILVAVKDLDGGKSAAVLKATQLAWGWGAELELFHALTTPIYLGATAMDDRNWRAIKREERASAVASLEQAAAIISRHKVRVSVHADWDYPAYEAIVRRAHRIGADLVVADRHPGKHTAKWLLRYADWELLRKCPVPFLLVKQTRPYHRPVVLAGIDPKHTFAKPLSLDRHILDIAGELRDGLRGTLHAVHAWQALPIDASSPDATERKAQARARKALEHELARSDVPPRNRHLAEGHPANVIPATARRLKASIVVMGAISRTGYRRLLIGNTAETVLDELSCDILVVKPAHFHTRVPRRLRGPAFVMPPDTQWI